MPEIDNKISRYRRILLSSPRSYPLRSSHLQLLAGLYNNRCSESGQKEDLDMSILYSTEAVFVASHSDRVDQDIVLGFYRLATTLINRLQLFKQPSDVQPCIEYFRYLESQPLESFRLSSDNVKVGLLEALASQLVLGNAARDNIMDEMMVRCRDLLASNVPQSLLNQAIRALVSANDVYTHHSPVSVSEYSEMLIDRLREANRRPGSHDSHDPEVTLQLALHFFHRFQQMNSMDDYQEAMALFDKIITSESNRDCPGPRTVNALYFSALLSAERANVYDNPEYAEEAIYLNRRFLRIPSTDDILRGTISQKLADLIKERSYHFGRGTREDLTGARSPSPEASSFSHLIASLRARSTNDKTYWWSVPEEKAKHIQALQTVLHCTADIAEIAQVVKYCRLLLALTPPSNRFTFFVAYTLVVALFHAFKCTQKIEYLNQSIVASRNMLGMPIPKWRRFPAILRLHQSLSERWNLFGNDDDFDEIAQLSSMASKDTYGNARNRLILSYVWAEDGRENEHHTTSTAYETALSLMEDTLLLAPTLETQHRHLVSLRMVYEELPKNMASYEVSRGRLLEAIQALERGRALIWSEMRGFRTSIQQIAFASHLAEEFTAINLELETLTTSVSPDIEINDNNGHEDGEGMDDYSSLVVRHRELLLKRKELVSKIQALPGLEGFSKTPSFDTLCSAAVRGPVIIVNHSKWCCDILIVLHDTRPSLITTPDDFYDRAIELRNRLVRTRNNNPLESTQYQRALKYVLRSLHEIVGRPVIKELRRLKIPDQSRIWWCPTSVFCSLPLHAMGPIPSDDGVPRYFSDLYIPSYTPTLSALIESRKSSKLSFEKPSVLLVANPDDSLKDVWPEIWEVQHLNTVTRVTALLGKRAKTSVVLERLQDHQFSHFICHGNLVPEKPFDASFGLYRGNRLTLLDIVRSRLPNAEFAFLSACHTAELTEGSIADEGLHLAAAVQYCGFRSVVGTMWAMADQDGGDLAKHFYNLMFSSDGSGVPYHERSARALRDAVRYIRKEKRLPLEQWVNFVHYGA